MFEGGSWGWGAVRRVGLADRGRMVTVVCVCGGGGGGGRGGDGGVWRILNVCVCV